MTSQNDFTRLSPESSNISRGEYNAENKTLSITFKKGGIYNYHLVPEDVALAYKGAESVGKFFFANIKDKYPYTKL